MVKSGIGLVVGAVLALLAALVQEYVIRRNAFYDCAGMRGPEGAYPHEGGPAGFEIVPLPVAGVNCRWNAIDGGIITTFHVHPLLTGLTWAAIVLLVGGVALVVISTVRRHVLSRR